MDAAVFLNLGNKMMLEESTRLHFESGRGFSLEAIAVLHEDLVRD